MPIDPKKNPLDITVKELLDELMQGSEPVMTLQGATFDTKTGEAAPFLVSIARGQAAVDILEFIDECGGPALEVVDYTNQN